MYVHKRSGGKLFNLVRLKLKTKVTKKTIKNMHFTDDAVVTSNTMQELQSFMDMFSQAGKDRVDYQSKKHKCADPIYGHYDICIVDYQVEVIYQFIHLGSIINKCIGKAANTLEHLTIRVWDNHKLSIPTKMTAYKAYQYSFAWLQNKNTNCTSSTWVAFIVFLASIYKEIIQGKPAIGKKFFG